jgi:hypothetical protein
MARAGISRSGRKGDRAGKRQRCGEWAHGAGRGLSASRR